MDFIAKEKVELVKLMSDFARPILSKIRNNDTLCGLSLEADR